ncbi:uncharacterized protein LOC128224189 [Mya arenaria]|uniref:uncharacterized protein LOC128224189 n=1 Tax=Mya arenaria TaxID=6604 RepID=UPI0022E2D3F3|nr:uncharacterized protein LOC128224189 [Mya arenaria]
MSLTVQYLVLIVACSTAFGQIPDENKLYCWLCTNARSLSDCRIEICDNRTESCYMDQVITAAFQVVYRSGCRATAQCSGQIGLIGRRDMEEEEERSRRQNELVACSRCCNMDSNCNQRLCGISNNNVNVSMCHYCDSSANDVTHDVTNPTDCITYTICDYDEVCTAETEYTAGKISFRYGCGKISICRVLMREAFKYMQLCEGREGHRGCEFESVAICNACCAGGGCNYGSCHDLRERLYRVWKNNPKLFDLGTLMLAQNASTTP